MAGSAPLLYAVTYSMLSDWQDVLPTPYPDTEIGVLLQAEREDLTGPQPREPTKQRTHSSPSTELEVFRVLL